MLFILGLLGNFWIWRIFQESPLIFLVLLFYTTYFYAFFVKKIKVQKIIHVGVIILVLLVAFKTTTFHSLVLKDNDEQRIESQRRKFYNPSLDITRKVVSKFRLIDFWEGDIGTVTYRLEKNLFETIDPNIYFFGGHPRERVWATDFEKFPFILILPFLIGSYQIIKSKMASFLIITLIFYSIFGHDSKFGPILIFPVIVIMITQGLEVIRAKIFR